MKLSLFTVRIIGLTSLLCVMCLFAYMAPQTVSSASLPAKHPVANASPSYQAVVKPFLSENCFACHSGENPTGGLRLDTLAPNFASHDTAAKWKMVFGRLSAHTMPPPQMPRPPHDTKTKVLQWLQQGIGEADTAADASSSGRVVLRRLNRIEYENTLRDLLGVPGLHIKESLPDDASAQGFDNVGSALNLSTVLMQKFLDASGEAVDAAMNIGDRPTTQHWKEIMGPADLKPDSGFWHEGIKFLPDGTLVLFNSKESNNSMTPAAAPKCDRFAAPVAGLYRFRVTAYMFQSTKSATMSILSGKIGDFGSPARIVGYYDVPVDPSNPRTVEFTDFLPKNGSIQIMAHGIGARYIEDGHSYPGPGIAIEPVEIDGPLIDAWPPTSYSRVFGNVDLNSASLTEIATIIRNFAPRAFRRPVQDPDIKPYIDLAQQQLNQGESPKQTIRMAMQAILCSPQFLYLQENPGRLDDYAVASRLSYFLWSTMPDDELMAHAHDHTLTRPNVLKMEAERMLNDPRAEAFTQNFTGQWLGLRQLNDTTPDPNLYPEFDDYLQWSMKEETTRFFDDILKRNLSVNDFVDSKFAMLNDRMAEHYGISGVSGSGFQEVALPDDSHRGGVLCQASILKVTANGTNTSPVLRGVWVLRNIVGHPPQPPPPNVPAIEPDIRGATTIREQLILHRRNPTCMSCHSQIDPAGNALENFDVLGGWRDRYRSLGDGKASSAVVNGKPVAYKDGLVVDASDTLSNGRKYQNIDQFKKLLLADPDQFPRCLTSKLLIYSTGGVVGSESDIESEEAIVRQARTQNYGFRNLVFDIIQSPLFLNK